jgi:YidC/Oxa1 family membrane protein insertase
MFPISRQTAMNMVKMQELKPEIDRIAERYKDDMQKRSQAQQELFRKHQYNPAAGCLPLFIQLPIFMGLYRALAVDVELRQAPLISDAIRFCSNLAAPDMFLDWSAYMPQWMNNGEGMFGFGPYFNLLPLVTVGLFLLQQKLFMPEPTNDQMRMQQQMMKYMMLFMGLMFFKVPSGLCIYFIASSLWGIAERRMLPKPKPSESPVVAPKTTAVKQVVTGAAKAKAVAKRKKRK